MPYVWNPYVWWFITGLRRNKYFCYEHKWTSYDIIEKVFSGRILLKGNKTFSLENNFLKNLKIVSAEGEIFINIILNLDNKLLTEPVIFCPTVTEQNELIQDMKSLISKQVNKLVSNSLMDEVLSDELKKIIRSYIKKSIGLKPLTYIEIVRI